MKNSKPGLSNNIFKLARNRELLGKLGRKKEKVELKFLLLIVIICFILSLLIFIAFDMSFPPEDRTPKNRAEWDTCQEVDNLRQKGMIPGDIQKMVKEYDEKKTEESLP